MAVGYFQCDECNEWGCCVVNLDNQVHIVERHVSPDDVEVLYRNVESPSMDKLHARNLARAGRLKSQQVCGTWRRKHLVDIVESVPQ